MKLFRTLHDTLEARLPSVADEAERLEARTCLRGLKSVLATVIVPDTATNVIQFEGHLLQRRIETAVAEQRQTQLADARRCGEHCVMDNFGRPGHDDID